MKRIDWAEMVTRLNESKTGQKTIQMGSDGSAQVTRVRLLSEYDNLYVQTSGPYVKLSLTPFN